MHRMPAPLRSTLLSLGLALLGLTLLLWPQMGHAQPNRPGAPTPPLMTAQAEALMAHAQRLHPLLLRQLLDAPEEAALLPIVVEWRRQTDQVVAAASLEPDPLARRAQVVAALQADAASQSRDLRAAIDQAAQAGLAAQVRAFWASPILALDARPALIQELVQRPDVVQVRLDEAIPLDASPFRQVESEAAAQDLLWNLQMLDVTLAETALGLDGQGIVVAIMDTGVDWQHPLLIHSYRGYHPKGPAIHAGNWYAATNEPYVYPGDGYGHGTHVAGTILGDDQNGLRTGVAPGAKWIAVKIFNNFGYTYESWIHDGFQWLMAPNGDPALAPHVVNSSWGSADAYDDRFRPDVAALRAAGILPIFAAGNSGPTKGTIQTPGGFPEALAVAAVDQDRLPATFSSRGPSPWDEVKPEVAAPGVNILSAYLGGYAYSDGTSMAAPHVSGVAALILQANPQLTPDQVEEILVQTSRPLGSKVPNNDTGMGVVNAYAAGLRVTQSGELRGQVLRSVGGSVAYPQITATPRSGDPPVTILGDARGTFTVALRPGLYDVTGRAFGFTDATVYAQRVQSGGATLTPVSLALQPMGTIFGRITAAESGIPLAASITVNGTPVRTQSDANNGAFSLALPQGVWDLRIEARGHRVGHITQAVTVGVGSQVDPLLEPAPTILVIDTGRWYYRSRVQPILESLDRLDYLADLHTVRNPFGQFDLPNDAPTAARMAAYDLVIWSAPYDSPSYIRADDQVQAFLDQGGRLLLSGEDIAYWDAGGSIVSFSYYFPHSLGAWYQKERSITHLTGTLGSPLAGVSVGLKAPDPRDQQITPDAVEIQRRTSAQPLMAWADGSVGAITSGICQPFRAAWLGFGLQGAQTGAEREAILARLIPWSQEAPAAQGILLGGPTGPGVGLEGQTVSHTILVDSTGVAPGIYDVEILGSGTGAAWPVHLSVDGQPLDPQAGLALPACDQRILTVQVDLPANLSRDQRGIHQVRLVNRADPTISDQVTLTSKTPAPLLLVDDERFYHNEARYQAALDDLPLGYDTFVATNDHSPSLETLYRYPVVLWFTGYDWFQPLTQAEQAQLATYLDTGGRLILSSQDLLDLHGTNDFVKKYLGVNAATLTITSTDVAPARGSPLGQDFGPFLLDYPIPNWSDGLRLTGAAQAGLEDENGRIVAALTRGERWRSAFFPFSLEALAQADLRLLLGRTLAWVGPFSGSRLDAPSHVAPGALVPITFTLASGETTPQVGASARLPLPPQVSVVAGSVRGEWQYSSQEHALSWSGVLLPGAPRVQRATLYFAPETPPRTRLDLDLRLETQDDYVGHLQTPVWVNSPWLTLDMVADPLDAGPGEAVVFTLTLENRGQVPAQATLVDPLPRELLLDPDSAIASQGSVEVEAEEPGGGQITWRSELAAGGQAQLTFRAVISPSVTGGPLRNRAVVTEVSGQRQAAAVDLLQPRLIFLPVVGRGEAVR